MIDGDLLRVARSLGLTVGFDVDDDLPQGIHVCWPSASRAGALCASPRLWGHGGTDFGSVDCGACAAALRALTSAPPLLVEAFSKLAAQSSVLEEVACEAGEALWVVDNPGEAAQIQGMLPGETWARVRGALSRLWVEQ